MRNGPSGKIRNFAFAAAAVVSLVGPDLLHARPLSADEKQVHQCALDTMRGERMSYEELRKRKFMVNEAGDDVMVRMVNGRPGAKLIVYPLQQGAHAQAFAQRVRGTVAQCGMGSG
jgi:hypothetical protein